MSERPEPGNVKYPGILTSDDGSGAIVQSETAASEAAAAFFRRFRLSIFCWISHD